LFHYWKTVKSNAELIVSRVTSTLRVLEKPLFFQRERTYIIGYGIHEVTPVFTFAVIQYSRYGIGVLSLDEISGFITSILKMHSSFTHLQFPS